MSDLRQAIVIRPETAADSAAVRAVLEAAFGRKAEAELADALRAEALLALSLVAEQAGGRIAGYAGFPRLYVEQARARLPATGLGPLAVAPDLQRRGIGAALIEDGLARLTNRGETAVFVVGDPAYYGRFGFDAAAAADFSSPYAGPHFMLRRLAADAPTAGRVIYPRPFAAFG